MFDDAVTTDFAQYSLSQLIQMLYESDPSTGTDAAQTWDLTGKLLSDQSHGLRRQLLSFDGEWEGGAAQEYGRMITDLIGGIKKVAETAFRMRDLTYDAVDGLNKARAEMPAVVDVPVVPPATLAMASTPLDVPPGTPQAQITQLQQQQAAAVRAVQAQQQASAAASAAHAKAVQVMRTLAGDYVVARSSIPPSPDAASVGVPGSAGGPVAGQPVVGTSSTGVPIRGVVGRPVLGIDVDYQRSGSAAQQPVGPVISPIYAGGNLGGSLGGNAGLLPTDGGNNPLFGDMFTVGLAAASAAAAGRFGALMPQLPGFAKKSSDKAPGSKLGETALAGGAGFGAARLAGGGLPGGGLAGGAGGAGGVGPVGAATPSADAAPAASAAMGGVDAANAADLAGGAAAGTAAGAASGGAPMMPMMPMSGMAGQGSDLGGNRRVPPWLVETEDVWGTSSPVAPGLIGDDPF